MSYFRVILVLLLFLVLMALLVVLQVWMCKKSLKLGLLLPGNLVVLVGIFLLANIPTFIFGGIWLYFKCRHDGLDALQRMQIEDLE